MNFLGMAVPLLISLIALPILIDALGLELYGLLAIILITTTYLNVFDLGIGEALTKVVAEYIGDKQEDKIQNLVSAAHIIVCVMGVLCAITVYWVAPTIAEVIIKDTEFQKITTESIKIISIALPLIMITSLDMGVLSAYQETGKIAIVKIYISVVNSIGPLVVFGSTGNFKHVVLTLAAGRVGALILTKSILLKAKLYKKNERLQEWKEYKKLLNYGGWMTISGIIGPLMTHLDRLYVSKTLGLTTVTYYTIPYDVLMRINLIIKSVTGVLLAAFSTANKYDKNRLKILYIKSSEVVFWVTLIFSLTITINSELLLGIWLSEEVAQNSTVVMQIISLGLLYNSVARVPRIMLLSTGYHEVATKLHVLELIPYLLTLIILTESYGIEGTAFAWSIRCGLDAILHMYLIRKYHPDLLKNALNIFVRYVLLTMMYVTVIFSQNKILNLTMLFITIAVGMKKYYPQIREHVEMIWTKT